MKSLFITGGAGFIGSHTSLSLLEKGYVIFILDSFVNSSKKSIAKILKILNKKGIDSEGKIYLIDGDLKLPNDIEKVFQMSIAVGKRIESVIHFAGLKSISDSLIRPLEYWNNNVNGTINLLKVMEKYNCKNLVFSSSATVYKAKSNKLLKEDDICEPINPYGNTKLTIEKILNDIYKSDSSRWRIACLRYFNPVGAHESALIGEDPLNVPNNLYPRITKVALGEIGEIKIFGSNWPTPDGTGIRDYIHVMDLADGHSAVLEYLLNEKPQFLTLNLGTGKGTSVLEFIRIFEKVNKTQVPFCFEERREGDKPFVVADNSLARSILNWSPNRTIEDICKDGWAWQLKNPNGFRDIH